MGFFKKALGAVSTGGLSLVADKIGKDTLFGKKDMGTPGQYLDLDASLKKVTEKARPLQELALDKLNAELNRTGEIGGTILKDTSRLKQAIGEKNLLAQGEDSKRRAEQLVAQRGLGRSSVGLNALVNADKSSRDGIAELRANQPEMENQFNLLKRQLKREDINDRASSIARSTSGINSILGTPGSQRTYIQGRQGTGQRSGGIANLAMTLGGAAIGGKMGGAQGAATGMQVGSSAGNILGGM